MGRIVKKNMKSLIFAAIKSYVQSLSKQRQGREPSWIKSGSQNQIVNLNVQIVSLNIQIVNYWWAVANLTPSYCYNEYI